MENMLPICMQQSLKNKYVGVNTGLNFERFAGANIFNPL